MGEIDYRHPHWGHSFTGWKLTPVGTIMEKLGRKPTAEFSGWCTPVPSMGDTVLIEMNGERGGEPVVAITRWEFTEVDRYSNPPDMYHAHVRYVGEVTDPPKHTPASVFGSGYREDV